MRQLKMSNDALDNPLAWDIPAQANTEALEKQAEEQHLLDTMYFECFKTPAGKKVIEHLVQNTIRSATWMPSLEYDKAIAHGFAREGQNALVTLIEQRIDRGRTGKVQSKPKKRKKK